VSAVHSRRTAGETVSRAGQRRAASRDAARAVLPLTVLAPVVLVVGFVVAQGAQLRAYDPIEQTVSTLAGRGATDRWIMTTVLLVTGTIYLVVASGLRPLGVIARLLLGLGGAMVLAAALAPQPAAGSSAVHMTSATIAWAAFASWPLAAAAGSGLRRGLRLGSLVASGVLVVLMGWFCAQLWSDGTWLGVAERVLLAAQTVWPIAIAASLRVSPLRVKPEPVAEPVPVADEDGS